MLKELLTWALGPIGLLLVVSSRPLVQGLVGQSPLWGGPRGSASESVPPLHDCYCLFMQFGLLVHFLQGGRIREIYEWY